MRRCSNCGWLNQDRFERCEKCDSILQPSEEEQIEIEQKREAGPDRPVPVKASKYTATILDASRFAETLEEGASGTCPKCGYPLAGKSDSCPNCGARLRNVTLKEHDSAPAQTPAPAPAPAPRAVQPQAPLYSATVRDYPAGRHGAPVPPQPAAPAQPQPAAPPADKGIKGTIRDFFGGSRKAAHVPAKAPDPVPAPAQAPVAAAGGQIYRLVPVSDNSYPVIYLSEGDIVTIGNRRYKFEK